MNDNSYSNQIIRTMYYVFRYITEEHRWVSQPEIKQLTQGNLNWKECNDILLFLEESKLIVRALQTYKNKQMFMYAAVSLPKPPQP